MSPTTRLRFDDGRAVEHGAVGGEARIAPTTGRSPRALRPGRRRFVGTGLDHPEVRSRSLENDRPARPDAAVRHRWRRSIAEARRPRRMEQMKDVARTDRGVEHATKCRPYRRRWRPIECDTVAVWPALHDVPAGIHRVNGGPAVLGQEEGRSVLGDDGWRPTAEPSGARALVGTTSSSSDPAGSGRPSRSKTRIRLCRGPPGPR